MASSKLRCPRCRAAITKEQLEAKRLCKYCAIAVRHAARDLSPDELAAALAEHAKWLEQNPDPWWRAEDYSRLFRS